MPEPTILSLLPEYIKAVGLVGAAAWGYWKFVHQRANEPATDIDVSIRFVGVQDGKRIVVVTAKLKNQSLVRVEYKDFRVRVRYLLPSDKISDGDAKLNYQLRFAHSIDERIDRQSRKFGNVKYLNPRQEFQHRYVTFVPAEATFVWALCRLQYTRSGVSMDSQIVARAPNDSALRVAAA